MPTSTRGHQPGFCLSADLGTFFPELIMSMLLCCSLLDILRPFPFVRKVRPVPDLPRCFASRHPRALETRRIDRNVEHR